MKFSDIHPGNKFHQVGSDELWMIAYFNDKHMLVSIKTGGVAFCGHYIALAEYLKENNLVRERPIIQNTIRLTESEAQRLQEIME